MTMLILACIAFVGSHFVMSHPLRPAMVAKLGDKAFLGVYSLVSFATLGWVIVAYRAAPPQTPLWPAGEAIWGTASLVMLIASILLAGSFFANPALPGEAPSRVPAPRGVFAITRHPMMWGFALWALVHMAVFPIPANLVLSGAILILALGGAAGQDVKKAHVQPDFWPRWQGVTSFVPFGALLTGRAQWAAAWPGWTQTLLGIVIWLAATWAHMPLAHITVGIWRALY